MKVFKRTALSCLAVVGVLFSSGLALAEAQIQVRAQTDAQATPIASQAQPRGWNYYSYFFGRVWTNTAHYVRYDVTNTGDIPLTFQEATISGMFFDAWHSCGGVLQPGQRCWFEIQYFPGFEGYHSGRFRLAFREDVGMTVDVWGESYR